MTEPGLRSCKHVVPPSWHKGETDSMVSSLSAGGKLLIVVRASDCHISETY